MTDTTIVTKDILAERRRKRRLMGKYINIGNDGFRKAREGEYVDKSMLINFINSTLGTEQCMTCVTRARRFGKSMAAKMLSAYYDQSCDSRALFADLKVASEQSFDKHLNRYPVIYLDMTYFLTMCPEGKSVVTYLEDELKQDLCKTYPEVVIRDVEPLMDALLNVCLHIGKKFIMIIDEWDAICREFEQSPAIVDDYINMLRRLFKGGSSKKVFAGVYMTGILPIKKYDTQSALNNFREYSVVNPGKLASYFGFQPNEVESLANRNSFPVDELKEWYDGYRIGDEPSIYNPYSVIEAIENGKCTSCWSTTGAYDSVVTYINRNFEGLKDDIILMLAGGRCRVNTTKFQNDLSIINSKDDVLTVLIHLGYLSYDPDKSECYIPNKEVRIEMTNAVEATDWKRLNDALAASEKLLADTLEGREEAVARGMELAHDENTSILS